MKRIILDIETSGLLSQGLDYTSLPYKLKPDYQVWCVVCRDIDTNEIVSFVGEDQIKYSLPIYLQDVTDIIGHNITAFDLPVLMLWANIQYKVGHIEKPDTLLGHEVKIWDTYVLSKLLYSDTVMNHGLEAWGKTFGNLKSEYNDWTQYTQEMLAYCIQDTSVNQTLFFHLMKEYDSYTWAKAYEVEKKIMDITFRQSEYGFKFNIPLAEQCVEELTGMMGEIASRVNPVLPPKKLNKGELSQYIPPKKQFCKDGSLSALLEKFIAKHEMEKTEDDSVLFRGQTLKLPLPLEPIVTTGIADIDDIEHIKWYLLSLGWEPLQYRERDLSVDADKRKRSAEDYKATVERYVTQTVEGLFCDFRCNVLNIAPELLMGSLMGKDRNKPNRVPTSPSLTVGVEKEICPNLLAMANLFPFAREVVNYYTYKHRKNSIAGGVDEDSGEPSSGFLSQPRIVIDGRIPTPADTNGANTSRYTHKVVCNIPRTTSLYGENMRKLFGVDREAEQVQLGFDFASLEAVCQGHFCLPYTNGVELAKSLVAKKPNDVHSVTGRNMGVDRNTAKSLNYMSMFGAQPPKIAKSLRIPVGKAQNLYNAYWDSVPALAELKEKIVAHWNSNAKKFIKGLDGRKLYSRSQHSLLNLCIQNAGALASKYTIVYIDQYLEEAGMLANIFAEDIHNLPRVQQMMVSHDECQYSVHKSLVSYKMFDTEEEAEANVTKDSSAVCHGNKYYLAYSPLSSIITKGIESAKEHLSFRLDLGFEWKVSGDWAGTH